MRIVTPGGEVSRLGLSVLGPSGLVFDGGGNLYVSESGNSRILRYSQQGERDTVAGGIKHGFADGVGSEARFHTPEGLAIDAAGAVLYVADQGNNAIRRVHIKSGVVSTLAGWNESEDGRRWVDGRGTLARFDTPVSLALSADGLTLYVADSFNSCIRSIELLTGEVRTVAGNRTGGFARAVVPKVLIYDRLAKRLAGRMTWQRAGEIPTLPT